MKKKGLALLLSCAMVLSTCAVPVAAADLDSVVSVTSETEEQTAEPEQETAEASETEEAEESEVEEAAQDNVVVTQAASETEEVAVQADDTATSGRIEVETNWADIAEDGDRFPINIYDGYYYNFPDEIDFTSSEYNVGFPDCQSLNYAHIVEKVEESFGSKYKLKKVKLNIGDTSKTHTISEYANYKDLSETSIDKKDEFNEWDNVDEYEPFFLYDSFIGEGEVQLCGTLKKPTKISLEFEKVQHVHKDGEWKVTKEATCTEAGSKELHCSECEAVIKTEEIPATGHTDGAWKVTKEATCTAKGAKEQHCSVCDAVIKTEEIPATGHTDGEWKVTKEATCTEKGSKELHCSVCDAVIKTEEIPALGHKAGAWKVTKEATCTAKGAKEQRCSVCNTVLKTEEIAATGHQFGAWVTTTPATALAEGVQTRTCAKCKVTETQQIAKLAATGKLSITNFPLKVKQKYTVKVDGMAAGDYVVSWSTSNKKIATVSNTGKVTGKKKGKATITATLASGLQIRTTVKVQKGTVKTKSITVNSKNITLNAKEKYQITAVIAPLTSKQKLTWSTSNKKIVKVDKKGRITARKKGKATITVKSGSKKVKIKVTVK